MNKQFTRTIEDFKCEHCSSEVTGDGFTNHCPNCLWSKHVDINPGDRAAHCTGLMKPVKLIVKTSSGMEGGKILHRCTECNFERINKVSKNDEKEALFDLLKLDKNDVFQKQ